MIKSTKSLFLTALILCLIPSTSAVDHEGFNLIKLPKPKVHVKWGQAAPGTPATITYTVAKENYPFPNGYNCPTLYPVDEITKKTGISNKRFKDIVDKSFSYWSEVANLNFQYVDSSEEADIVIGASRGKTRNRAQAGIRANLSNLSNSTKFVNIEKAAVCLNTGFNWDDGFGGEVDAWDIESVMTHEIGHTIGLNHYYGARSRMDSSYDHQEEFVGLERGDVEGAVFLYGPAESATLIK